MWELLWLGFGVTRESETRWDEKGRCQEEQASRNVFVETEALVNVGTLGVIDVWGIILKKISFLILNG